MYHTWRIHFLEDAPCRAKPEVKSTFCHSRVGAAAADQHLEGNGGFINQIATFGRYEKVQASEGDCFAYCFEMVPK